MQKHAQPRTGGQVLVDCLLAHGVDTIFCVAGESYIAVLDALYDVRDRIKVVTCRHESGATFMAEAYGKLTGKPGIAYVTRGPGACNATIGVHTAFQDSTPMILFIGQVASDVVGREGFQEIDFVSMFTPMAKWAVEIDRPGRIPEILNRAFYLAQNGRRGPVVISTPEDVTAHTTDAMAAMPSAPAPIAPAADALLAMQNLLLHAKNPLVILGGGGWTQAACSDLQHFLENNHLPTAVAIRRQDLLDNRSPVYCGDLGFGADAKLVARLKSADLLLVIGDRIGEMTSREFTAFHVPQMAAKLIHVLPDPGIHAHIYRSDVAITATMPEFALAVKNIKIGSKWADQAKQARADYLATLLPTPQEMPANLADIVLGLSRDLPDEAIVINDAGNFAGWLHRFFQWKKFPTQLGPGNGAMGYAVPASVAAALLHPDRPVVAFVGDGGFMMMGQEIATAMMQRAAPIIILVNNAMYGSIRMHQEKHYPSRVVATDLHNPDFIALVKSYGAFAIRVEHTADFAAAFAAARASGKLAVLEIPVPQEFITSHTTITAMRGAKKS